MKRVVGSLVPQRLKRAARPYRKKLGAIRQARQMGKRGSTVLVHDHRLVRDLPDWLAVRLHCGPRKGKIHLPDSLTILLVHDRAYETVMEQSLRYLGIQEVLVARPASGTRWVNALKVELGLEALRNHRTPPQKFGRNGNVSMFPTNAPCNTIPNTGVSSARRCGRSFQSSPSPTPSSV